MPTAARRSTARRPDRQQGRRPRQAPQAFRFAAAGVLRGRRGPRARNRPHHRRIQHRGHPRDLQPVRAGPLDLRRGAQAHHARRCTPIYEQASGETTALFRQTSERFTEIVRQMRDMSAEMQRELESTRGPSSAAAFSNCRRRPPTAPRRCAASSSSRSMRSPSSTGSSRATAAMRAAALRSSRQPMRRAEPDRGGAGARAPRPDRASNGQRPRQSAPAAPAARARRAAAPADGRGGWLYRPAGTRPARRGRSGGTIARRAARPAMASLDSLSVDIARMIDHDAAAELWDRYKRGERNVFTRRLYTVPGAEDVRGYPQALSRRPRVQADGRPLHRGVRAPARRGRAGSSAAQQMSRSYLTSDTGKVYTMLAHAIGTVRRVAARRQHSAHSRASGNPVPMR